MTAALEASASSPELGSILHDYAGHELFRHNDTELAMDNPYRRGLPVPQAGADAPATGEIEELLSSDVGLFGNRVLLTIYERDFVLLPRRDFATKRHDFSAYYGAELTERGDRLRPHLERQLFAPLEQRITVAGEWTYERFVAFHQDFVTKYRAEGHGAVTQQVLQAPDPKVALRFYLIQAGCDFLVESSAMGRNALGSFGPVQSELFKVIIDECGYGVDRTRHSTMFQRVMESVGLDPTPHTYWGYYLPTTLYTANYYNYIGRNHARVFRYLGALLHVESCFRITCRQMAAMAKAVEGPEATVDYFTEHVHIDDHHSRMALEDIIRPAVAQWGSWALEEVLRGFEESCLVGELHTEGLARQLRWISALQAGAGVSDGGGAAVGALRRRVALAAGQAGNFAVSATPQTLRAVHGDVDVVAALRCERSLREGEQLAIPSGVTYKLRSATGCELEVRS